MLKPFLPGYLSHRRHNFVLYTGASSTNWQYIRKKQELKRSNLIFWHFFCLKMHKTCFTQSNQSSIGSYSPVFCLQQWPKLNTENNLRIWFTHTCVHTHAEVCMQHLWNFPHLASHMSDDLQLKVFHSQSGIFQQSVWLCKYQSLGINDVIHRDKRPCWCIIHENQKKNVD